MKTHGVFVLFWSSSPLDIRQLAFLSDTRPIGIVAMASLLCDWRLEAVASRVPCYSSMTSYSILSNLSNFVFLLVCRVSKDDGIRLFDQ